MLKSDHFVTLVHILHSKLSVRCATIIVLHDRIADIDRIAGLDMVEEISHIESNGRNVMIRVRFLDELQLQMAAFRTHLSSHFL